MERESTNESDGPVTVIRWQKWETILRVLVYVATLVAFGWALLGHGQPLLP